MFNRLRRRRVPDAIKGTRFLTDGEKRSLMCNWPHDVQQRALTIARMLRPFGVTNARKVRVGGDEDGGYVMLDDFRGVETAFSLGVGPNVDWDHAIAERGIEVHQFDHTVDGPPRPHEKFRFHKRKITPAKTDDSDDLVSMLDHAITHRPASSLLKIDIENAEWEVFARTNQDVFNKFSQILCEFHAFEYFHEDWHYESALQGIHNLKRQFEVVHIHANNSSGVVFINDAPLPFVLEVTLANRSRYDTRPSQETYPTEFDRPNDGRKPDYDLGRFEI